MSQEPVCKKCSYEYPYESGGLWICPQCNYEWVHGDDKVLEESALQTDQIHDANGNILKDGDSVSIIKDLKVKGSSSSLKVGTKVKSIKLVDSTDGHNISCRIDGFGSMNLKSEFVKKI